MYNFDLFTAGFVAAYTDAPRTNYVIVNRFGEQFNTSDDIAWLTTMLNRLNAKQPGEYRIIEG